MKFYPTEKNVGELDRRLRIGLGGTFLLAALAAIGGLISLLPIHALASAIIGGILLVTGLTQKCPINEVASVDTFEPGHVELDAEPDSIGKLG